MRAIWIRPAPGGPNYAYHFLRSTLAFLPGLLALVVGPRRGQVSTTAAPTAPASPS